MPNVTIQVGERPFSVACAEGEEAYLTTAAAILDAEATALIGASGRMPEVTMLLMSGLMLADKTAGLEDRVAQLEADLEALRAEGATTTPALPDKALARLADLAAQAEALADQAEAAPGTTGT